MCIEIDPCLICVNLWHNTFDTVSNGERSGRIKNERFLDSARNDIKRYVREH